MPGYLAVELIKMHTDRSVRLVRPKETPVAQPRDDPAFCEQNSGLNLGFVTRFARSRGHHSSVAMRRHIGMGAIDGRVMV